MFEIFLKSIGLDPASIKPQIESAIATVKMWDDKLNMLQKSVDEINTKLSNGDEVALQQKLLNSPKENGHA